MIISLFRVAFKLSAEAQGVDILTSRYFIRDSFTALVYAKLFTKTMVFKKRKKNKK